MEKLLLCKRRESLIGKTRTAKLFSPPGERERGHWFGCHALIAAKKKKKKGKKNKANSLPPLNSLSPTLRLEIGHDKSREGGGDVRAPHTFGLKKRWRPKGNLLPHETNEGVSVDATATTTTFTFSRVGRSVGRSRGLPQLLPFCLPGCLGRNLMGDQFCDEWIYS